MARPRKSAQPTLPTARSPAEAVAQALDHPFESFGIVAGATDRFGGEAVALEVVQALAALASGQDTRPASGLALLLAQTGVPGDAELALNSCIDYAKSLSIVAHVDLMLPLCCAGIPLDPRWFEPLATEQRALLAKLVAGLVPQLEHLLTLHGGQRATSLEATLSAITGS